MKKRRKHRLPMGVYPGASAGNRYVAAVRHEGTRYYLGSFETSEEAAAMVQKFRKEHPLSTKKPWKPGDKL